jgi:filamentous hemagglutinin
MASIVKNGIEEGGKESELETPTKRPGESADSGPRAEDGTANTSVYRFVNAAGETQYVGITKNLEQRAAAHLRQKGIVIDEIPGLSGLSRADARAIEQVLIEFHGLGKNGGMLMNKINSIAKTNPAYGEALTRGAELLRGVGYPGF